MLSEKTSNDKTIVGHLGELRNRLIIIAVVNIITILVCFRYSNDIIAYYIKLNPGMQLIYITPSEQFMVNITLAIICGVIVSSPITIGQIWAFIVKGLTATERSVGIVALYIGLLFFILGAAFCYFVILPFTLKYFYGMTIEGISAMISIQEYVSFINTMIFSTGLVFEMPVVVFTLTSVGIIKPAALVKSRGVLIIIIFTISAIVTPPDVVSQIMLGVPMVILLELSIYISKMVFRTKNKESTIEETATQ